MSAKPEAEGWPVGTGRYVFDAIDSTNAEAVCRAPSLTGPAWFVAAEQTGGRGRRGRPWSSPRGNLYATLLLQPKEPADQVALRSFAAALALREACVALTGLPEAFTLKWPNDVLLNGGKLAGILLESAGGAGRVHHLAIGIGVNLVAAPTLDQVEPGATVPVSLWAETGLRILPETFLTQLAICYDRWETIFQAEGFAPLRKAWLSQAARIGEPLRARTGTAVFDGVFETIDEAGALVLATAKGRMTIAAADIYFQTGGAGDASGD
ncbi:MAG: biotin--[acetyl-CoA-carboxylase] ligase [Pseudorhodobacter sp.]|nr:biotin--[acetyl-CoA-carboxylase] ligase [Pseudorhodobacter sp.]